MAITPTGLTGDSTKNGSANALALLLGYPTIADASGITGTNTIADKDHFINDKHKSGKQKGAGVLIVDDIDAPTSMGIAIALGTAPTDKWATIDLATLVTPA